MKKSTDYMAPIYLELYKQDPNRAHEWAKQIGYDPSDYEENIAVDILCDAFTVLGCLTIGAGIVGGAFAIATFAPKLIPALKHVGMPITKNLITILEDVGTGTITVLDDGVNDGILEHILLENGEVIGGETIHI